MSILTFKIKHNRNFSVELDQARKIAQHVIESEERISSSKHVKDIGLPAAISNAIIYKYRNNKKIKRVKSVKLTVPNQHIQCDNGFVYISCLDFYINVENNPRFPNIQKINQIEISRTYAFISVSVDDEPQTPVSNWIGIDLNSTSHSIVVVNKETGNVKKYGKSIPHIKKFSKNHRKKLQKKKWYQRSKACGRREYRKTQDILHKITTAIVKEAVNTKCGIRIEKLEGIREKNTKKVSKTKNTENQIKATRDHNHTLNSWPFYEFRRMLTYKCLLLGVRLEIVEPQFTSQECARCGNIDKSSRNRKKYHCVSCEHLEHADVNAAFVIASRLGSNPSKNASSKKKPKLSNVIVGTRALIPREGNSTGSVETLEPHII